MTILVLCNVGNRDVERAGQPIKPARSHGEAFLKEAKKAKEALAKAEGWPSQEKIEHYHALWDSISLPIITPMLDYVLAREKRISRLVLYTSDQPLDPKKPQFHDSDTIHTGQIVAAKLRQTRLYRDKIAEIESVPVSGIRPNMYDEAFERFGKLVAAEAKEVTRCHALVTGGTPQFNMALVSHAVMIFGDCCQTVYLPEGSDQPFALNVGTQLRHATERQVLSAHLKRCDFAAAASLLDNAHYPVLRHLVHYGKHRFHFDFTQAREHLDRAWQAAPDRPDLRAEIERLGRDLEALVTQEWEALINELYWNARLCYLNGRYVDFLGRVFRLREAVGRQVVETVFNLKTDNTDERNVRGLVQYVTDRPSLEKHLTTYRWGWKGKKQGVSPERGFGAPLVVAMIGYLGQAGVTEGLCTTEEQERYNQLHQLLHGMDSLSELRSQCIIAHGWRGVSRVILLREYRAEPASAPDQDPPLVDLKDVVRLLGEPSANPYAAVAELVCREMLPGR